MRDILIPLIACVEGAAQIVLYVAMPFIIAWLIAYVWQRGRDGAAD